MTGWIITKDVLEGNDCGVVGPRNISKDIQDRLLKGEGVPFKMYDGDGELYYEGRLIGDDYFAPLDDYGCPNAGCTDIKIKVNDVWETV